MKDILAVHPEVATLPFEHRYTVDPRGILPFYSQLHCWSPYIADYKVKDLISFLQSLANVQNDAESEGEGGKIPYQAWELSKWIPGYEQHVDQLEQTLSTTSYTASYPGAKYDAQHNSMIYYSPTDLVVPSALHTFLQSCHQSIVDSQDAKIFVEDNTWTCLFAKALLDLLPDSFLIYMVRDPRDVVASMLKQRWTPNTLDNVITYYCDLMNTWLSQRASISKSSYIELRLEDLVLDAGAVLSTLSTTIDISVSDEMRSFDLSLGNVGRYKVEFDAGQINHLNTRLAPYLSEFQYG